MDLLVGAIDPKQTLDDKTMEPAVGQHRDARIGLSVEMRQAGHHLPTIAIEGAEVEVTTATVLLLVDEIVQQDVQALHPGEVGIPDLACQQGGAILAAGVGHETEHAEGRTGAGSELVPGHRRPRLAMLAEPGLQQGNTLLLPNVLIHLQVAVVAVSYTHLTLPTN